MTIALVLAIAAILLATAALFVAHTWRGLVEDLARRLDNLERDLGVNKPGPPQ